MFLLDGKQLRPGRPFTGTDGTQYPANWLQLTSLEEKEAIGITEVPDPQPIDSRFYTGRDSDGNLIPKELEDIGPDPVTGITTVGLKTVWTRKEKRSAGQVLSETDWYVVRNAETGTAIPVGIASYRAEIRSISNTREGMINSTTSTPQLANLLSGIGTAVVGYTTTLLPEWPNLSDYT